MSWRAGLSKKIAGLAYQLPSFALVGASRTVFSLMLYWGLNLLLPYWVSFTVSFAATLVLSAFISSRFVFVTQLGRINVAAYAIVYVTNYFLSLGLLLLVVEIGGVRSNLAPLFVIPAIFPLSFVAERWALHLAQ